MERYIPPKKKRKLTPAERKRMEAQQERDCKSITKILTAYLRIDTRLADLEKAREELKFAVLGATKEIYDDHKRFYASGGCTYENYKAWLGRKDRAIPKPVKRRKHLRLVVQNKYRQPALPRLRDLPDDPEVA